MSIQRQITLARRARLIKSFNFRKAAFLGRDCKSENKSCSSASNNLKMGSKAKMNKWFFYSKIFLAL